MAKGRFIVFEGIDGSGKSTQITMLGDRLKKEQVPAHVTFEPTDGPVGRLIRQMLSGEVETDQRTIACLFAADRTDHLVSRKGGICGKIEQGLTVLCDRYYFSSYAYHAQYIDMDWVIHANALNAKLLKPDITIFIDVPPKICFERIRQRGGSLEMYEKIDIMKKVRENYLIAFDKLQSSETVAVIDGSLDETSVAEMVWQTAARFLEK